MANELVYQKADGWWYFRTEDESEMGPYTTEGQCREHLKGYLDQLNQPHSDYQEIIEEGKRDAQRFFGER